MKSFRTKPTPTCQVAQNALIKAACLMVIMVCEVWFTRFLIRHIGNEVYGIAMIAANIVSVAAISNWLIMTTLGRFTTLEIHQGRVAGANTVFNTGLLACVAGCVLILAPVFILITWQAPLLFNLPPELAPGTRTFFTLVFSGFGLTLLSAVFTVGGVVQNRLDLLDLANLARVLISRLGAAGLVLWAGWRLCAVGAGILAGAMAAFIAGLWIWRRLTPELGLARRFVDPWMLKRLGDFSGWLLLHQTGLRLLLFADVLVVSHLFGAAAAGMYAVAAFFAIKLRQICGPFLTLLNPVILKLHARGDRQALIDLVRRTVRLSGMAFALPVGLLCGMYGPIFKLWLGSGYDHLFWPVFFLTCPVGLTISCYPYNAVQHTLGRVKGPALFTLVCTAIYPGLVFALTRPVLDLQLTGVALAGALVLVANQAIYVPWHVSRLLGMRPAHLLTTLVPGLCGFAAVFIAARAAVQSHLAATPASLCGLAALVTALYLPLVWRVGLLPRDREFFKTRFELGVSRFKSWSLSSPPARSC